jgi:hypothetical protein
MGRILFFVPFGTFNVHNQLDAIFAAKLRLEGADPLIIRCDGLYEFCDVLAWSGDNSKQACRTCAECGNQLFDSFELPYVQLRDYLTKDDHAEAERWANSLNPDDYLEATYDTLPIGQWVISSIFSYFRITDRGLALPEVRQVYKSFLKSGLLTYRALSRLIVERPPLAMFIFNARFAPYRIAFEVSQRLGIQEITHERGFYDDSFELLNNTTCIDTKPIFDISDSWKDKCLSSKQLMMTQQYLQNRENGLDLNYPAFYEFVNEYYTIRHTLRIPVGARILAVFTSSEFEHAYCGAYSEVTTQLDRLDEIIALYRTRQDYLVIRHHPHIAGTAQGPPENDFLTRAYQQASNAPANVRIIMPSESINSYSLLRNVDGVISFFSSVGYEAAGRGVGVASLHQAPFSKAMRYTVPENIDELDSMISMLFEQTAALDREDLRKVFRFIYAYIYRLSVQFRSFGIKNNYEMDIRIQGISQLAEGFDPELDRICKCVLDKTSISKTPDANDSDISPRDEEEFFDNYIASIRQQRQIICSKSKFYAASRLEPDIAVMEMATQFGKGRPAFSSWMDRSRYKKMIRYRCNIPLDTIDPCSSLSNFGNAVSSIKEEYVMIACPNVYYDESYVSSAMVHLLNDVDLKLKGVFSGAWLLSKEGIVENEVFTKKTLNLQFSNLASFNSWFTDPLSLFSLTVFRKNELIGLINSVIALPNTNKSAATMEQLISATGFHKTLVPLTLISHL